MTRYEWMDFLKVLLIVFILAGGSCIVMGLVPRELAIPAALVVIGLVIRANRNQSLV